MTTIEPLRKIEARRVKGRRRNARPDPVVDLALIAFVVVGAILIRRRLGRAATERTGTWVGTIR